MRKSRLKTYGFLIIYYVFCFIAVSSLTVFLYGYRSSAGDFCSKSSEPQMCFALRIRFFHYIQASSLDFTEFLMTQHLCIFDYSIKSVSLTEPSFIMNVLTEL